MIGCVALIGLESLTKRGMPALEKDCGLIAYQCKSDEKLVSRLCPGPGAGSPVPRRDQSAQTTDRHPPEHHEKAELPREKAHRGQIDRRGQRHEIARAQREEYRRERG